MQRRRSQVHTHLACRLRRSIAVLGRDKAQKSPHKAAAGWDKRDIWYWIEGSPHALCQSLYLVDRAVQTRKLCPFSIHFIIPGFQVKYAHEADAYAYNKEAGNVILGTVIDSRSAMRQRQQETAQVKKTSGSSDLFATRPYDFSELVWENGQLVMQKQCNWPRKSSFLSSFSTQSGRGVKEKDTEGRFSSKPAKISGVDPVVVGFTFPRYVACGSSAHADASVPWIKDPTDEGLASEALEHDCCAGILNKSLQFDPVPSSVHKTCTEICPSACLDEAVGVPSNMKHDHVLKASIGGSELGIIDSSKLFKSKVLSSESKVLDVSVDSSNIAQFEHCKDMMDERLQNQRLFNSKEEELTNNPKSLLNFAHFARPVSLAKVALRNFGRLRSLREHSNLPNENPVAPTPTGRKPVSSPHKKDLGPNLMTPEEAGSIQQSNEIGFEDALRKNNNPKNWSKLPDDVSESKFAASMALNRHEIGVGCEVAVAPSMCSGNFSEEASYAPKVCEKRKEPQGEESEYKSEDFQDVPVSIRIARAKRSLASDVHKLSEKKRRKRINKKIDALQELIPNCDRVDKASVLEEAIDYVKTLQLQVQIMTMARELCMHTMLLPPVTMVRLPPPVVGISGAIELGFGMGAYGMIGSMAGIPQMLPLQFPCTPTAYQTGMFGNPGPASVQMNGVPLLRMPPFTTLGEMLGTSSDPAHTGAATEVSGDH